MKKTLWILTLGLSLCGSAFAQNFDDYFIDKPFGWIIYLWEMPTSKISAWMSCLRFLSGQAGIRICQNFHWREMAKSL